MRKVWTFTQKVIVALVTFLVVVILFGIVKWIIGLFRSDTDE